MQSISRLNCVISVYYEEYAMNKQYAVTAHE